MMQKWVLLIVVFFAYSANAAEQHNQLSCGLATGYPPYQFTDSNQVTGFDADIIRAVSAHVKTKLVLKPSEWLEVVNSLRFDYLDCIVGIEVSDERLRYFDFTRSYYHRKNVLFVLKASTDIQTVTDLYDHVVTSDKHSYIEQKWTKERIKDNFRLVRTDSKLQAMKMLASGESKAAIMPLAVGLYLADNLAISVKVFEQGDPGSPVALAVKKGNSKLLKELDGALAELLEQGDIERIYQHWFPEQQLVSLPTK